MITAYVRSGLLQVFIMPKSWAALILVDDVAHIVTRGIGTWRDNWRIGTALPQMTRLHLYRRVRTTGRGLCCGAAVFCPLYWR